MKIGDTLIDKGQKWQGSLKVTEEYSMPVNVICGVEEGKTLVITAGVHGCEYVGIETARCLWKSLKPEELKGQVIILPLVNAQGFYQGAKQIVPADGENLNRMFPGKADGTLTQQMAYVIEKEIYPHADFLVDLHGGDCNEAMEPLVFFPVAATQEVNIKAKEAASYLPIGYRVRSTAKNGLYSYATQQGIPALLLEIGGEGKWHESQVAQCKSCVSQLMVYLKIYSAEVALKVNESRQENGVSQADEVQRVTFTYGTSYEAQKEIVKAIYDESEVNGFWYSKVKPNQKVTKGEVLGEIRDLEGRILEQYVAQLDGVILYHTTALGIQKGDPLIAYGTY